jgi:hypothetical protein
MNLQNINGLDKNLQYKTSTEANNKINYLDTLIRRDSNAITIGIYRQQIGRGTVIRLISSPLEQKKI